MYFIVKYNLIAKTREVINQVEDPVEAYIQANMFDAQFKVGMEEDEAGKQGIVAAIEDENGNDCWAKCASLACPSIGIFN